MKNICACFLSFFSVIITITAQTTTRTYEGETLELRTEVEGALNLRWNTFSSEYRFFAEKDGVLYELLNTKKKEGYEEEYIAVLEKLTADQNLQADKVRLTLGDLRTFFNQYNQNVNPDFVAKKFFSKPNVRLGGFLGVTNNIYTSNPENVSNPQLGIEFEILDPEQLPRHAAVFQLKHALSSDEFDYSVTQLSLNYRYKFIKSKKIDVFVNSKFVTLTRFSRLETEETLLDDQILTSDVNVTGTALQAPLLFGLGTDIRLGKGYLTLAYNDALGIFVKGNESFPVDLTLGYKFVL